MTTQQATDKTRLMQELEKRGDHAKEKLAIHLNVSPVTVWRWAKKDARPHRSFRKKAAKWFDLTEQELWDEQ